MNLFNKKVIVTAANRSLVRQMAPGVLESGMNQGIANNNPAL